MKKPQSTNRSRAKRLTKAEKEERAAFAEREKSTRKWLEDQVGRAIKLRSKDREFHGLEREFLLHQTDMLTLYNRAKDAKHPRDIGAAREQIL